MMLRKRCHVCGGHGADPMSDTVNWLPCQFCAGRGSIEIGLGEVADGALAETDEIFFGGTAAELRELLALLGRRSPAHH